MFIGVDSATPIQSLGEYKHNRLFVKRDDMIPFCFGGNKARKAILFFEDIDKNGYNCVVTYGSSSSNHCRVVANMCAQRGIPCYIVSPLESSEGTFNSKMMNIFGAKVKIVPVNDVHDTIEKLMLELKETGLNPYFIQGGGHGNIGTQAYVNCFDEILDYENRHGILFDYIFLASGTGTTQAGLVCGKILHDTQHTIVGVSIARKNPRGRDVILKSIKEYLGDNIDERDIQSATIFIDDYTCFGYGKQNNDVSQIVNDVLLNYGIPLDTTYTGKAFYGMENFIKNNSIENKNILFLHTGGTPLFFDYLREI